MSRFSSLYHDTIVPELMKKFGYKTVMQVPQHHQDHAQYGCW